MSGLDIAFFPPEMECHYVALTLLKLNFVDQAGIELTELHLPLFPKCMSAHPALQIFLIVLF